MYAWNKKEEFHTSISVGNGSVFQCRDVQLADIFDNVSFDEVDVAKSIDRLKCNLSVGPDGLPPVLFKKLKYCLLFNYLISVGYVPQAWLNAIIVPVFKKCAAGELCNYRPISLTCVPSKIMERVLSHKISATK